VCCILCVCVHVCVLATLPDLKNDDDDDDDDDDYLVYIVCIIKTVWVFTFI